MSYLSVHPTGNQDRHGGNQKETERFLVENKQRSELGRMAQLVGHVDQINQLPAGWEVCQECDLEKMH